MLHRMICSAVVTVVLAAFSAAVVLGTAGFAVRRRHERPSRRWRSVALAAGPN